jgi:L-fucose isomerase-like protein
VVLDDVGGSDELLGAVHDVEVWHRLHATRLGVLGPPSDWLVASTPDRDAVHRLWGLTLIDLDLPTALHRMTDIADEAPGVPVRFRVRSAATPPEADVEKAARFEPVLRDLIEREHLDAITVRCFDLILDAGTSGCLALSALNDSGVIAGCEGDIASTLALLWAKMLVGRVGWMANPAMIHRGSGIVELAHCTVPLSLVNGYELRTHFESGLGVGIAGGLPAGPVTLLRLGGDQLEQLWCTDGDALATGSRDDRCRTQLDVRISPTEAGQLLDHPLGNHLVVVDGHHASRFIHWWRSMIQVR